MVEELCSNDERKDDEHEELVNVNDVEEVFEEIGRENTKVMSSNDEMKDDEHEAVVVKVDMDVIGREAKNNVDIEFDDEIEFEFEPKKDMDSTWKAIRERRPSMLSTVLVSSTLETKAGCLNHPKKGEFCYLKY